MTQESEMKGHIINRDGLPKQFPTHFHSAEFWEELGRTVATFGFLEEVLGKAIFAFTGTRKIPQEESEAAFEKWLPTLQRALSDPLGGLIDTYVSAVKKHPDANISHFDDLAEDLRKAASLRNVLCHGSWQKPDGEGRSLPLYVNNKQEIFETRIDAPFLRQVQAHTVELICAVINSVSHMGWQFPGSSGPGKPVMPKR